MFQRAAALPHYGPKGFRARDRTNVLLVLIGGFETACLQIRRSFTTRMGTVARPASLLAQGLSHDRLKPGDLQFRNQALGLCKKIHIIEWLKRGI